MQSSPIVAVEWATLEGQRPRQAGCNARLEVHGLHVRPPIARLTIAEGATGFGLCNASPEQAETLLGRRLDELLPSNTILADGLSGLARVFEYPLWDLWGQTSGKPVYQLAATLAGKTVDAPLRVPCYDTSLYIDDLHLASEQEAAQLIAKEAKQGYDRSHRSFKIKIGRGARHMELEEGTQRDIAVIHAVREAVGPDCRIMIDANNGYNLNLTKRVLAETAACNLFWLEEAFHEDRVLYEDLHGWIREQNLGVLIADGEGQASPTLMDWAREGWIEVVQYDIFSHGFMNWLATGTQLDAWGVRTAPHHYGRHYGNYVTGHLVGVIQNFTFVEWDEATTPGLDGSAYQVDEGYVLLPDTPGFGIHLEEERFQQAVAENGFKVSQ